MIVRLHLHQDIDRLDDAVVALRLRVGEEAHAARAFDHRGVVAVSGQHTCGVRGISHANHGEQRLGLRLAVDDEFGIEDLVPAVLGVRLREHHELDIGGVASERAERLDQIVDLIARQREPQLAHWRGQVRHDRRARAPPPRSGRGAAT